VGKDSPEVGSDKRGQVIRGGIIEGLRLGQSLVAALPMPTAT